MLKQLKDLHNAAEKLGGKIKEISREKENMIAVNNLTMNGTEGNIDEEDMDILFLANQAAIYFNF